MAESSDRESIDAAKKDLVRRREARVAQIGQPIPGSSLVRDYCVSCGEAIRVTDASRPNTCLDCRPTGCPGTSTSTATRSEITYHGGRFTKGEW